MPNCDFYALEPDLEIVLDFVFEKAGCRVFEKYSEYGKALSEFRSVAELKGHHPLGYCRGNSPSVLLMLLPESAGELVVEQIPKELIRPDEPVRFAAGGWGLISLQLGGESPTGIVASCTNHNSEKRAMKWRETYEDVYGPPSAWDWALVESTSRRINSFIRKVGATKLGARPVLPAAAASGMSLDTL